MWAIALISTDGHITGMSSTVVQYIFAIFAAIHGLAVLILTLLRARDIRKAATCRSTDKYDIYGTSDTIPNDLALGMEKSPVELVQKSADDGSKEKEIDTSDIIANDLALEIEESSKEAVQKHAADCNKENDIHDTSDMIANNLALEMENVEKPPVKLVHKIVDEDSKEGEMLDTKVRAMFI